MKKLSVAVLVLLLISMVAYGQSWQSDSPSGKIYVNPTSTKVGIGTTNPNHNLHVEGTIEADYLYPSRSNGVQRHIRFGDPTTYWAGFMWNNYSATYGDGDDFSIYTYNNRDITLYTGTGNIIMFPSSGGNVGIGTTDPQSKLAVNGTITAKEVLITLDGWPDFIFADNYKLMPLDKLEKHIEVNKSLPGIPTEKEVLEGGVRVGDMQAKFLEKIEELTLYTIAQEKRLGQLEKENGELKETNENLENRISALEK